MRSVFREKGELLYPQEFEEAKRSFCEAFGRSGVRVVEFLRPLYCIEDEFGPESSMLPWLVEGVLALMHGFDRPKRAYVYPKDEAVRTFNRARQPLSALFAATHGERVAKSSFERYGKHTARFFSRRLTRLLKTESVRFQARRFQGRRRSFSLNIYQAMVSNTVTASFYASLYYPCFHVLMGEAREAEAFLPLLALWVLGNKPGGIDVDDHAVQVYVASDEPPTPQLLLPF